MLPFPKTTVWIGSATLLFLLVAATTSNTSSAMTTTTPSSPGANTQNGLMTPTESRNAKLWNRFAKGYAASPIQDEESYQTKLAMTQKYFSATSTTALEFGCGTGGTALWHAPHVKRYDAIDISSQMIDIARAKQNKEQGGAKNVHFAVQGLDSWQAPDASYDVILGLSILHLLPNRAQVMRKVHRLLKPGGIFVSSTVCIGDMGKVTPLALQLIGRPLEFLGVIPAVQVFTKTTLRQELQDNGFVIQEEFHPGSDKAVFFIAKKVE